jgi:hypothetical protein
MPVVNDQWVQEFMFDVNQYRISAAVVHDPALDSFSALRFQTMTANYQLSHFGFNQDVKSFFGSTKTQTAVGEVVFYPVGQTPEQYLREIETTSPLHWKTLTDDTYRSYGYFIGQGPTFQLNQNCPTVEIPGPNINITSYFQAEGCTVTVTNSTWLVIDFSS